MKFIYFFDVKEVEDIGNMIIINIISIIISSISLIISLIVFLRSVFVERFCISCKKVKWFGSGGTRLFYIWLIISNKSQLPITITDMSLTCQKNIQNLSAVSRGNGHLVYGTNNDKINSLDYPICIEGYSSIGGYVHFYSNDSFNNFENQDVRIKINTIRGSRYFNFHLNFEENGYRVMQKNANEIDFIRDSDGNDIDYNYDAI